MDNIAWRQIPTIFAGLVINGAIIVPVTDTRFRLPWIFRNPAGESSLVVSDYSFSKVVWNSLDVQDGFHVATMRLQIVVIKVRTDIHTRPTQRQKRIIKIKQIGVMLIDQIARSIVKVLDVGDVG